MVIYTKFESYGLINVKTLKDLENIIEEIKDKHNQVESDEIELDFEDGCIHTTSPVSAE